jgi:polyribonucleotide nucleotidyltransferase
MFPAKHRAEIDLAGRKLIISTGEVARQAGGAVLVQYGDTVVLGTATMGKPFRPDANFMPLLVEYEEKFYAAGKIKGSRFIKREGRPTDEAIVTSRLIDRAIRPLFPDDMINDAQVVLTVLSYDNENDPDIPAMIAACGALMLSDVPWNGPLGALRVGRVNGAWVINPTTKERETSDLDLVIAGSSTRVVMLEAAANELSEHEMVEAITTGKTALGPLVAALQELQGVAGKSKQEPMLANINREWRQTLYATARPVLLQALAGKRTKPDIARAESETVAQLMAELTEAEKEEITEGEMREAIHDLHGLLYRELLLSESRRDDGRKLDEVRPLRILAGILPRTHGSGLFQRGETQVLTTLTLGGPSDVQLLDTMEVEAKKHYIHYYNFPAFSVGEIKPSRGPGRREIGHGALAERALLPVLPDREQWPYTMLLVSEALESHGSTSMASVCGSTLALMDGGVPIKKPVAGIAMGLVTDEQGNYKILTDIAGIEDEKGDMDFKVAGTRDGITAIQMDIKVAGITEAVLTEALAQAQRARFHILDAMAEVLAEPRSELAPHAPRIHTMRIPVEKIGDLIGPKGKHINEIIEQTGVEIDIEDDGLVSITSNDATAMEKAKDWVHNLTREIKPGEKFEGRVTRIMDFGAFIELVPGVEGMVHISQFREEHVDSIHDVVKVGDIIPVLVLEIDAMGRINLSHKAALPGGTATPGANGARRPGGGRGGGHASGHRKPFRGPRAPRR